MSFNQLSLGKNALNSPLPWLVAVFPVIGVPLQIILSNLTNLPAAAMWVITIGGCAWGCSIDQRALLRSYAIKKPLDTPWFIPRYLYRRSQLQNIPPFPAMIWSGLMTVVILSPWTGWLAPIRIWVNV